MIEAVDVHLSNGDVVYVTRQQTWGAWLAVRQSSGNIVGPMHRSASEAVDYIAEMEADQ